MTIRAKCPCGHVFDFDTEKVSFTSLVTETASAPPSKPMNYLPKCPKCKAQVTVPNPDRR